MTPASILDLVGRGMPERADALHAAFAGARPFRHCVADDFLAAPFAEALLDAFPTFSQGNAVNEDGRTGGKSVVERIQALDEPYRQLDRLARSGEFLALIGRIAGIDDLLYDPWYFGGGTHENRHGQSLDSHVDFNLHPNTGWHRRLNLIVYLNPAWSAAWGGVLRLTADPLSGGADDAIEIVPAHNRMVLFETTEHSWHGFNRIELPQGDDGPGRKSIALYFYTAQRPAAETAPRHSTIYVDDGLPAHLQAGKVLGDDDLAQLRGLFERRDRHARRLYDEIARLQARLDLGAAGQLADLVRRIRARLRR